MEISEMEWPGAYCDGSSQAHYNVEIYRADGFSLFGCKWCQAMKILSNSIDGSMSLSALMIEHGEQEGYSVWIKRNSNKNNLVRISNLLKEMYGDRKATRRGNGVGKKKLPASRKMGATRRFARRDRGA